MGLQQGVAAIEGERRDQHAAVAQLDQRLDAAFTGRFDQRQRVAIYFPHGRLRTAGAVLASILALLQAVFEGGHGGSFDECFRTCER
ncbi:hypothetical protein D3C85_1686670 [compost metagenome]